MRFEFSEEELKDKIKVPKTVEQRLKDVVEKCLDRCGLYHQVFSRIKTHHSLARKYQRKCYNEDKKIQDLIGIRVDLYFEDDLKICRNIMEKLFGEAEWSLTEFSNEEFKPAKINGVFRLPAELKNMISDETWDCGIDDTFEIQLKTVFFEGWHEIEHDMKYKGMDLWSGKSDRSRYFNTILATLELCDKSIVTLFDNLGHDLYHEKNWAGMIKAHFRIKIRSGDLYPELQELFDADTRVDNTPKRIFKTKREDLVYALLARGDKREINVNTIVAVLNEIKIHDPEVQEVLEKNDVFGKREDRAFDEELKYDLKLPEFMNTFYSDVIMKTTEENRDKNFNSAVNTIYSWIYNKFSGVLLELKETPGSVDIDKPGFRIVVDCNSPVHIFNCRASHIDQKYPGRIWMTSASIKPEPDGQLRLNVRNGFTYYRNETDKAEVSGMFSCPRFYRQIATQIGIKDVWDCGNIFCITNDRQAQQMLELMLDERRIFPIVMVVSANENEGRLDEVWLGSFAVRYMQEKAGHYVHFARVHAPMAEWLRIQVAEHNLSHDHMDNEKIEPLSQGIFVLSARDGGHIKSEWFNEEYIKNCKFASFDAIEHLQTFRQMDYGRVFGSELLQLLRKQNTSFPERLEAEKYEN
ncbi:MAG: hypothetical protein ACI39R_03985 [Lachnospiraceae bacterium]